MASFLSPQGQILHTWRSGHANNTSKGRKGEQKDRKAKIGYMFRGACSGSSGGSRFRSERPGEGDGGVAQSSCRNCRCLACTSCRRRRSGSDVYDLSPCRLISIIRGFSAHSFSSRREPCPLLPAPPPTTGTSATYSWHRTHNGMVRCAGKLVCAWVNTSSRRAARRRRARLLPAHKGLLRTVWRVVRMAVAPPPPPFFRGCVESNGRSMHGLERTTPVQRKSVRLSLWDVRAVRGAMCRAAFGSALREK